MTNPSSHALQAGKRLGFKADGKAFRRVVPLHNPNESWKVTPFATPIARDHLVICNGGGGVPVVEKPMATTVLKRVIDKISAALLAKQIHADALLIPDRCRCGVSRLGKPTQRPLARVLRRNGSAKCNSTPVQWGPQSHRLRGICLSPSRDWVASASLVDGSAILAGDKAR